MLLHRRIPLAAVLVLIAACTRDAGSPVGPDDVGPSGGPTMGILDAAHNGGRAGFYFLPPLVKQPSFTGTFDATLLPEVRVCQLSGTTCIAGPPLASWTTTSGTGGAVVKVDAVAQRYQVDWDTKLTVLDPTRYYRIVVLAGGIELGYADVDPVSSGSELKNVNTDEYIALKDGRTLPIAFRVETGTVGTVTVSPARDTVPVGGSAVFSATVTDLHGNPLSAAGVAWTSSNVAVATVSPATGASTAATAAASLPAQDSARIVATIGGVQGSAVLTVTAQTAPDAVDDAYSVPRNGTVSAPPAARLLDNDVLGVPAAELDSLGGGVLGGGVTAFHVSPGTGLTVSPLPGYASGSLTVFRDGAFSFTPPLDSTGVFTFRYLLKNAVGSDSATVTVIVDGPPAVTATSPVDGAAGVADSVNVVIGFSEPVAAAAGAFALECPVGTPVSFSQSASPSASYTLDPAAALPWGTTCRVTVDASKITDLGPTPQNLSPGNHVFTFTVDEAPRVTSTTPADGADDVLPTASVVINFSESVNATLASFTIDCGTTQPFALSASPATTFTLDPTNQLPIGGSCTVTVHAAGITDADTGDPPDAMQADSSFSFSVPIVATDDNYPETVTGNLLHSSANITTPFTVVANDLFGSPVQVSAAGGSNTVVGGVITGTTAQGGTVVMTAAGTDVGTFTYDPPRGYEGADQFTYTIQLVSNPTSTATATVSLAVSGMVWFVDNESACASACDGRWSHPYTTLGGFAGDNGGGGSHPAAGDHVFIYESATPYTGPVTLLNTQRLIGQDASQSLSALTGITPTSGSTPFPATNAGNAAQVHVNGGGITLGQNNRVHGLRLGTTTGTGIAGASIGTLTVDDVKILALGAAALSLANGTAAVTVDSLSSTGGGRNVSLVGVAGSVALGTGTLTASTVAAFSDSAGSAVVTYAGSVSAGTGRSVSLRNRTGGSVTLSGALADSGLGMLVQGNSGGTIAFTGPGKTFGTGANAAVQLVANTGASVSFGGGGLAITTTSGAGFSATGGGTIQVTGAGNTISSGTGTALNVQNTTIGASGLTFVSISHNGGANGIHLANTGSTNGLQVTGTGSAGTGGTIQNTTGPGISLTSTTSPSFSRMIVQNTGSHGIYGALVNNFSLTNSTVTNSGTSEVPGRQESNLSFYQNAGTGTERNVTGTVTITGNTLTNALHHGINITQYDGTIGSLNVSNNTFTSATSSVGSTGATASKGTAVNVNLIGSGSTIASLTSSTISNNVITGFPGNAGILFSVGNANTGGPSGIYGTAADSITIQSNRIRGHTSGILMNTQAVNIAVNGRGTGFFRVLDNGTLAEPITNVAGHVINLSAFGTATLNVRVTNNRIVANNTVGSNGISMGVDSAAGFTTTTVMNAVVSSNVISATDGSGILGIASRSGTLNARYANNTIGAPATSTYGLQLRSAASTTNTGTVCFDITGNNVTPGPGGTFPGIGLRRQSGVVTNGPNVFGIVGLSPSPAGTPDVENFVNSLNTSASGSFGVGGTALISASTGFTSCTLAF